MVRDEDRWLPLIAAHPDDRPRVVGARTPLRAMDGVSDAVLIDCDDDQRYVVKGRQIGRPLIADQVVGCLGRALGAPVAEVALVNVPAALIEPGTLLEEFAPGIGHGSVYILDCVDDRNVAHEFEPGNNARFALLAVLYGWAGADDRQYLYQKQQPRLVWSVDHGYFLAGAPWWTSESLNAAPNPTIDRAIATAANVGSRDLQPALERLSGVTDAAIAAIVAVPPDAWGITMDERVALAAYLARRRDHLLAAPFPAP